MQAATVLQVVGQVVAVLIGALLGLAIADFEGVEPFLYKWQTLIAGTLAVMAAALTIVAMMASDNRQQNRHRELVEVSLRDERRRLSRAVYTSENQLWAWITKANALQKQSFEVPDPKSQEVPDFDLAVEADFAISDLREIYGEIEASGVADVLDGRRSAIFRNLGKRVRELRAAQELLFRGEKQYHFDAAQRELFPRLKLDLRLAQATAMVLVGEFRKMGRAENRK